MSKTLKPSTTVAQQIVLLRERGMRVDESLATQWLENVSYYRLSAYWFPARLPASNGEKSDSFQAGISFTDVVALYEADRKLRTLIHDGIERIEVAMRTRIGMQMCSSDSLFYTNSSFFRPNFKHDLWLGTAHKRIARAGKRNEAIQHYRDEYGSVFPFWVLAEVLDFADVSRLFDGLLVADQRAIAESLGIKIDIDSLSVNQRNKVKKHSPLARWLEQLTVIRNMCAHHGRLWNKSFAPVPTAALKTLDTFSALPDGQSERLFGALTVMSHLLRVTSPGTTWADKITALITNEFLPNTLVEAGSLGIPDNWNGTF